MRSEKLKLCDRFIDGEIPEFFFDRSWKGFNDILDVYRLGRLHLNSSGLCAIRMKALIDYWQIDELLLGKDYSLVLAGFGLILPQYEQSEESLLDKWIVTLRFEIFES